MNVELVDYLLDSVTGSRFEALAKKLFHLEYGEAFVPLGGIHDGGADAVLLPSLYTAEAPNTVFQFSITQASATTTKIGETIDALRKSGRVPEILVYATTANLPKQDILARNFRESHRVLLQVRDRERIKHIILDGAPGASIFKEFFAEEINVLSRQAAGLRGSVNRFVDDPTVFAFLDYELRDRFSRDQLYDRVLDALIYWALRETDPDAGRTMGLEEIRTAVVEVLPAASRLLAPKLRVRLDELSRKVIGENERVRAYRATGRYCLPFEMRHALAERNATELRLQSDVIAELRVRVERDAETTRADPEVSTEIAFQALHEYFVEQGLILGAFLSGRLDRVDVADQIVESVVERTVATKKLPRLPRAEDIRGALGALRGAFYSPSEVERRYLEYLSRTSMLFMTLQSAPRLIEYFNQMTGRFRLIVGSDLLIKALSESYLTDDAKQVTNLLKIIRELGGELILADPVVREVFTHLHATDLEFRNHYERIEPYMTRAVAAECDRILIRAYFYAKTLEGGPRSWQRYLNTMADAEAIHGKRPAGENQLAGLLVNRFQMTRLTAEELERGIDVKIRDDMAAQLTSARGEDKHEELSRNDATLACAVYAMRRRNDESATYDGFGCRTWWLTKERHVLAFSGPLIQKNNGVPYVMRPEFLLNFVLLAPRAAEVRRTFRNLLPTTVGLQLGQHLKAKDMDTLLDGVATWAELPRERVSVMMEDKVNQLATSRFKQYVQNLS